MRGQNVEEGVQSGELGRDFAAQANLRSLAGGEANFTGM